MADTIATIKNFVSNSPTEKCIQNGDITINDNVFSEGDCNGIEKTIMPENRQMERSYINGGNESCTNQDPVYMASNFIQYKSKVISVANAISEKMNGQEELSTQNLQQGVYKSKINGNVSCEEIVNFDITGMSDENDKDVSTDCLVTDDMLEQERILEKKLVKKEDDFNQLAKKSTEEEKEKCFKRLQHLLNKSSIYAKFLAKKIEAEETLEAKKKEMEKNQKERQRLKQLQHNEAPVEVRRTDLRSSQNNSNIINDKHKGVKRSSDEETVGRSEKVFRPSHRSVKKKEHVSIASYFKKEDLENHVATIVQEEEEEKPKIDNFSKTYNGERVSDRQPRLFTGGVMRSYQIDGFEWLKTMFENCVNGILGDEMGLGKTIQCIALIAYFVEKGISGPYLVCGPLSTVTNWVNEFKRFCPKIPVLLYHGTLEERENLRRKMLRKVPVDDKYVCPVVITSYNVVMNDQKKLSNITWSYIIVDEAHRLKNFQCKLFKDLHQYRSNNWLLLTGTPLQNNLAELWALLHFVLPEIFNDINVFQAWFDISLLSRREADDQIVSQEQEKHIVSTIHQILTPFLLRRTKAEVELVLPPKKEIIVYAPLTPLQESYYSAVIDKSIEKLFAKYDKMEVSFTEERAKRKRKEINYMELNDDHLSDEKWLEKLEKEAITKDEPIVNNSFENVLSKECIKMTSVLMMLRKITMHPYLVSQPLDPEDKTAALISEDLVHLSGKLKVLDQMLAELKKQKHKILIFSQMVMMLDILEDYCILRNYKYNRLDGTVNLQDRQNEIDEFNNNPSSFLFLISTRAGGLGINLASADTVIIYDSDWNPQCDLQAQDRCHRIGQLKPVVIYRLVVENTVDEKMVERAAAKRKLEKMIIQEGRFTRDDSASKCDKPITPQELLELLKSTNIKNTVKSKEGKWFTKKELSMLLDRSDMFEQSKDKSAATEKLFKVVNK